MQDIRYGVRQLLREPASTLVAMLTMALGIGATVTLFSVADGVLLRPLPWPEADRLVRVEERRGGMRGRTPWTVTNGTYHAWNDAATTVEGVGAWRSTRQTLHTPQTPQSAGYPERVSVAAATPRLFGVLRARPAAGRLFVEEDATPGEPGKAILSFGLWQRRFGGDRYVAGQTIRLDDDTFEIVGVLPREFAFPDRETQVWTSFRPLSLMSGDGRQMRVIAVGVLARLRPGVTAEQAAAEATARARGVPDIRQAALSLFGSRGEVSVAVAPAMDVLTAEVRPAIDVLLIAVGLLFVASTASVVSVQLARATARRHETAVRLAMGAGFARVTRLWLMESAMLGLCAEVVGVGLAAVLCGALPALLPADFPRIEDVRLDARSVAFAMAVTVVVSVICGLIPAFLGKPATLAGCLAEDGIAPVGLAMRTRTARMRTTIIIGQVGIACVLLIGGALLARSFLAMVGADRGYDASHLLTARLTFPHSWNAARRVETLEALRERLRGAPGTRQAAFGNGLPLVGAGNVFGRIVPPPNDPTGKLQISATWRVVSPEYLDALRLRLTAGRLLSATDDGSSPGVIVVNRAFEREYLGGRGGDRGGAEAGREGASATAAASPGVGQRLRLGLTSNQADWEVVGVVDDVRQGDVMEEPRPEFFVSYRQVPDGIAFDPMVLVRMDGDGDGERARNASAAAAAAAATLKAMVRELDQALVLDSMMTMDDRVRTSLVRPRAYALVLTALASLALAVAGVGLFGVLSYTTAQRTPEIGVRVALGARPRDVAGMVLRQAATMIVAGLIAGLTVTLLAAELLSKLLYGVTSRDVVSFTVAPLVIALVAVVACVGPARRAARVDPVRALRMR